MKHICNISLLMAASLLLACNGSKDDPTPEPSPAPNPETRTLTFVLPDYPVDEGEGVSDLLKTRWVAGDQIVVHGEYAKDQVTVTLKAEDIKDNGRTATLEVSGLYPYKRDDCTSTLYAEWPAKAVNNLKHCFFYSCFGPDNVQMMAACDQDNQFKFHNLSSIISFRVDGDYDSYTLGARKDVPIGYEFYQVKITDKEQNYRQYLGNVTTTVTRPVVADGDTDNIYYIPGGANLIAGYSIRFIKDEKVVMAYTSPDPLDITIGSVIDLGDITDLLEVYEDPIDPEMAKALDEKGTANCYVVYDFGTYKFAAVQGNSEEPVGTVASTKVLWETWNNGEEVTPKSVVKSTLYENGMMYFQIPEGFHTGNALIAALDKDEKILWSWHIWVPETEFSSVLYDYMTAHEMMSRNLGALVDTQPGSPADSRSFGLLYQWGRKDPFLGFKAIDSTDKVSFSGTGMTTQEGPVASQDDVFSKPTVFVSVDGGDWCAENDNLFWGDIERSSEAPKAVYDPCPVGYRVPARSLGTIFKSNGSTLAGWNYDAVNGIVSVGTPLAYFPICGYIKGSGSPTSGSAIVWDSRNNFEDGGAYSMFIDEGESIKKTMNRACGGSVRCMTE